MALFEAKKAVEPTGECPRGHQEAAFAFMMYGIRPTINDVNYILVTSKEMRMAAGLSPSLARVHSRPRRYSGSPPNSGSGCQ